MSRKNNRTEQEIREAIATSISKSEAIKKLGLDGKSGAMYRYINQKIKLYNIDCSHLLGQSHLKGKTHNYTKGVPIDQILIENSNYVNRYSLKNRLIKSGLLTKKCSVCSIDTWMNKPLVLQLDHINGINNDNRLTNLRLICPNCHSQTPTYCGKNIPKKEPVLKNTNRNRNKTELDKCLFCNKETYRSKTKTCKDCYRYNRPSKIQWPSIEVLQNMVESTSYLQTALKLGVSDNAVRKRLKNHK